MAGSGSDGTEDSDSSAEREQTNSSESDGNMSKRQRLTRASTRLSQSSQGWPIHSIQYIIYNIDSVYCLKYLIRVVVCLHLVQILLTWSELRTMMNLHHWHPQEMPPPLSLSWTSLAPMPLMMRARPKIKPAEIQIRTSPIDPSAVAAMRPTTLTWNAPPLGVIHSVKSLTFCIFCTYAHQGPSLLVMWTFRIWSIFRDVFCHKIWQY